MTQYDIIDVKPKSLETTPFLIARETVRRPPGPGLAAGRPEPAAGPGAPAARRAQIDIPVQEQLIVELYSK